MSASKFGFDIENGDSKLHSSPQPTIITIHRDSGRDTFTICVDGKLRQSKVPRDKIVQYACFEANLIDQPVRFVTEGVFDDDPTTFNNKWEKIK